MDNGDSDERKKAIKIVPWPTIQGGDWPYYKKCFYCGERDELRATLDGTMFFCPRCEKMRNSKINDGVPYKIADSDEDPTVRYKKHKKTDEDISETFWGKYLLWCGKCAEAWIEWFTQKWYKF